MKRSITSLLALASVIVAPVHPRIVLAEDAARTKPDIFGVASGIVAVVCPLTVGGAFQAKTSALSGQLVLGVGEPGALTGQLVVDLKTLQTGIGLRDNHLREKYLEVQRGPAYTAAVLDRIRVEGIDFTQPEGKARFRGVLTLHGEQREVSGTADIRRSGAGLRVRATFATRISDFQIPSPTYLGVGVQDEVTIKVSFHALSAQDIQAAR